MMYKMKMNISTAHMKVKGKTKYAHKICPSTIVLIRHPTWWPGIKPRPEPPLYEKTYSSLMAPLPLQKNYVFFQKIYELQ